MGSRKIVKYEADVIDSIRSDWHISDDGDDRGPIDSWPAPFLGTDNGSNPVAPQNLRRAGSRSGVRFDGQTGPIPRVLPSRSFYDDGGLDELGQNRTRSIAQDAFAGQRRTDALFSRTGVQGDAYAFLRRTDPGSDLTSAPRRGPTYPMANIATMAGAGSYFYVSDTAGAGSDQLLSTETLLPGQRLTSRNGAFTFAFQTDGNVVIYNRAGQAIWSPNTAGKGGKRLVMQKEGNLVLYPAKGPAIWYTSGGGYWGAHLVMQDDGNLVIYHGSVGRPIWASDTAGGHWKGASKSIFQKIGSAVESVGEGALSVGRGIGEGAFAVGKGVVNAGVSVGKAAVGIATSPVKLASDIAQGRNVFESLKSSYQDTLKNVRDVAPYAQAVLAVVPGVGSGVSAALGAGLALAQGQPITKALAEGVKAMVPGGPLAQQAFSTAYNLAQGQSLTDAALSAARSQLPPGPAQAAFDTGLALAHGKNIQDLAKEQGMALVSNVVQNQLSPIADRALSSTGPVIGKVSQSALSVLPTSVKQAAQALLNRPELRSLPASEVARRLGLPERDVQQALGSVMQAAARTGQGQVVKALAPAHDIASRIGNATFDQALSRFGSRMAPIAVGPNRSAPRVVLPRFPKLMPGAQGIQDAGAFATIKLGSSGSDVQAWQRILGVAADGKFGPQTDAATRAWQRAHGLTPDGVVGSKTWAAASTSVPASIPASSSPGTVTLPTTVITATPPPPLTPAQTAAAQSMPTIRLGSSGPQVATWQGILRRDSGISGYVGALDGAFGPQTDAATRAWQRSSGLTADGVVGPQTWKKAIGSLTTPPLPAETAPGIPLPTPVPPGLPPGLPPVPTTPVSAPPPIVTLPPIVTAPPPPLPPPVITPTSTPIPPTSKPAGNAGLAVAAAIVAAKFAGFF